MRLRATGLLLLSCAGCWAGSTDPEPTSTEPEGSNPAQGATETNVAPAPCETDGECPGSRCVRFELDDGSPGPGFCEAEELETEDE